MNAPFVPDVGACGRSVKEWVGKTPDSDPPRSVRARVFRRYGGRCYLTGRSIGVKDEWQLEHIKPLHTAKAGENLNRESNLAPALKAAHAVKSAEEVSAKSKADRIHAKHFGYFPKSPTPLRSGNGFRKRPAAVRVETPEAAEDGRLNSAGGSGADLCQRCGEEPRMVWIGFDPPEPYGYVCGCPEGAADLAEARDDKAASDAPARAALAQATGASHE